MALSQNIIRGKNTVAQRPRKYVASFYTPTRDPHPQTNFPWVCGKYGKGYQMEKCHHAGVYLMFSTAGERYRSTPEDNDPNNPDVPRGLIYIGKTELSITSRLDALQKKPELQNSIVCYMRFKDGDRALAWDIEAALLSKFATSLNVIGGVNGHDLVFDDNGYPFDILQTFYNTNIYHADIPVASIENGHPMMAELIINPPSLQPQSQIHLLQTNEKNQTDEITKIFTEGVPYAGLRSRW